MKRVIKILVVLLMIIKSLFLFAQTSHKDDIDNIVALLSTEVNMTISESSKFDSKYAILLSTTATKEDLISLTQHPSPIIRVYSIYYLTQKYSDLPFVNLMSEHLYDTATVKLMYWKQLGNRVNITSGPSAIPGALDVISRSKIANTCGFPVLYTDSIKCIDNNLGIPVILGNDYQLKVYPNPVSSGNIVISYQLSEATVIQFKIFDYSGREVIALDNEKKAAGAYTENVNISGLVDGIYLFIANINGENKAIKLIKL
jgi:hypothetical protein